jgi:hypothetical protein
MKRSTILILMVVWTLNGCASTRLSCETSGCNSEICGEKGKKMISPCVVLPQHECLRKTKCEVQENGKCGWTQNEEYRSCMKKFLPK